jgi:hypothetical protein
VNATAAASSYSWDVRCNICLEPDNFTLNAHHSMEPDIVACATACTKFTSNCTTTGRCCKAFTYLPMGKWNGSNCFLNSVSNDGASVSPVKGDNTSCGGTDYVGAVVVSLLSGGSKPAKTKRHCKYCSEFAADLKDSKYGNMAWSLHCHVDIPQHDMGALPDGLMEVDNITECARLCSERRCKANSGTQLCCQAFTFVYDNYYDQNCWLKTGLTLQSLTLNMTAQWSNLRQCVNTMSAWPTSFDWCQVDPWCNNAAKEAAQSQAMSFASIIMSGMAFLVSVVVGVPAIINCLRRNECFGMKDKAAKVLITEAPPLHFHNWPNAVKRPVPGHQGQQQGPAGGAGGHDVLPTSAGQRDQD